MVDVAELLHRLEEVERAQSETSARLSETSSRLSDVEEERDRYRQLYLEMMERNRLLERGLVGPKSESRSRDEAQISLGMLEMMLGERDVAAIDELIAGAAAEAEKNKPPKRRPRRKPLPEKLPRVEIEVLPDEVQREGLDAFERIGEEVTEVLERRPASLVVARIIKPKFVRRDRDRTETDVHVGATPALPIPRGLAGPGLLADTLVKRWQDHLPLHRLESIYARDGVELARSTV
ncbi:MAG: transposase, partial [Planctomycetota bacterium]